MRLGSAATHQAGDRGHELFGLVGLIVAGRATDWRDGAAQAAEVIDSGAARDLLDRWIAFR